MVGSAGGRRFREELILLEVLGMKILLVNGELGILEQAKIFPEREWWLDEC